MDFTIEELTMNAWPSLQTILLDGWIIRMAGGYTKRANSVNPIYSFENNLDEKITYCENIYRKSNLPVVFKIISCDEHKKLDQKLESRSYEKIDLTSVQTCSSLDEINYTRENLFIEATFTDNWKTCLYESNNITDIAKKETISSMLNNVRQKAIAVYKTDTGSFAGCGYGVIEKGYAGLFDIIVKKEFRGKRYGKEIVSAILAEAHKAGVEKAHLSVVDNNEVAKNLYGKLGFKEVYKYWYRVRGD